jgi:hypothetical protein
VHRHKSTRYTGSPGPSIRLNDVAVDLDGSFTEFRQIHHGTQRSPNQPLDFKGAPRLLAFGRFALHALTGRTRKHPILRSKPALSFSSEKRGHILIDARRAHDFRIAARNQYGTFGMFGVMACYLNGTKLSGGTVTWAHGRTNFLQESDQSF